MPTFLVYAFLVIGEGIVYGYVPRNTVAVVDNPLVIHCKATSNQTSISWKFHKFGGVGEELIASRTLIHKPGFSVNNTEDGQFSLVKAITQLKDAGTYQCLDHLPGQSPRIAVAQINVLLSDPECSTNASTTDSSVVENDFLSLWCQVSYNGSMVPIIEWSRSDGRNSTVTVHNSNTTGELHKSVTSRVTKLMTSEDNGVHYECKIYFDRPPSTGSQPGFTHATNVPDYTYSWYNVSKVLFAPRNISIRPRKSHYSPEDVLVCSADGNPSPTYEWTELSDTSFIVKRPILRLSKTLTGTEQFVYNCTATNTVSGRIVSISEAISFTVIAGNQSASDSSKTLSTIILTGCMTAGAFAAILFVCWFVCNRLQKKKKQSKQADGKGSLNSSHAYDDIEEHAQQNLTDDSMNCDQPEATTTLTISRDNDVDLVQQEQRPYTKLSANRSLPVTPVYTPLDQREPATNDTLYEVDGDVEVDYVDEN